MTQSKSILPKCGRHKVCGSSEYFVAFVYSLPGAVYRLKVEDMSAAEGYATPSFILYFVVVDLFNIFMSRLGYSRQFVPQGGWYHSLNL